MITYTVTAMRSITYLHKEKDSIISVKNYPPEQAPGY